MIPIKFHGNLTNGWAGSGSELNFDDLERRAKESNPPKPVESINISTQPNMLQFATFQQTPKLPDAIQTPVTAPLHAPPTGLLNGAFSPYTPSLMNMDKASLDGFYGLDDNLFTEAMLGQTVSQNLIPNAATTSGHMLIHNLSTNSLQHQQQQQQTTTNQGQPQIFVTDSEWMPHM
jgi:hypothetical protein